MLGDNGVKYCLNARLVRGLDYYSRTVFEWTTEDLGAQGTVCAGGRYDGLIEQLGGKAGNAVGFAIGLGRLCMLVALDSGVSSKMPAQLYLASTGAEEAAVSFQLAEQLRERWPGVRTVLHCGGGSLKSQMKGADRSGARYCVLLGSDELAAGEVTLKDLQAGEQLRMTRERLLTDLGNLLESNKKD